MKEGETGRIIEEKGTPSLNIQRTGARPFLSSLWGASHPEFPQLLSALGSGKCLLI